VHTVVVTKIADLSDFEIRLGPVGLTVAVLAIHQYKPNHEASLDKQEMVSRLSWSFITL
jgi:hypothetical protein